jgi:hypothetical protein
MLKSASAAVLAQMNAPPAASSKRTANTLLTLMIALTAELAKALAPLRQSRQSNLPHFQQSVFGASIFRRTKNCFIHVFERSRYKMEIVGTTPFGLKLVESTDTIRLGTDALLLSAYVKRQSKDTALEIGAGSGIISLLLTRRGCFKKILLW